MKNIDDVFYLLIRVLDHIQEALERFRDVTDNADFRPMALFTEELMAQNSADYTQILALWNRWNDEGGSKTSFDSWVEKIMRSEDEDDE